MDPVVTYSSNSHLALDRCVNRKVVKIEKSSPDFATFYILNQLNLTDCSIGNYSYQSLRNIYLFSYVVFTISYHFKSKVLKNIIIQRERKFYMYTYNILHVTLKSNIHPYLRQNCDD